MVESVTDRNFMFPNTVQENVLHNRVSGFTNTGLVALANEVQPFSFYGDYLHILDKNFVNPVSPGSTEDICLPYPTPCMTAPIRCG